MLSYRPSFIPTTFVVVGAGGTGSRLVPLLAQFLKTVNWIQNPKIYLVDNDTVEDKNLARQNFIKLDIGKPKAVVVADRYSKAFDINIIPVVQRVETLSPYKPFILEAGAQDLGLPNIQLSALRNAVIIMCVDSVKARKDILSHVLRAGNKLIIDSGNENDYGQILVYNDMWYSAPKIASNRKLLEDLQVEMPGIGKALPLDFNIPGIPVPADFYEGMVDVKSASCADLDQTLAINATMATAIMGVIQNFIFSKPLLFHKLNISLSHGSIPEMITYKYLLDHVYAGYGITKVASCLAGLVPLTPDTVFAEVSAKMSEYRKNLDKTSEKKAADEEVELAVKKKAKKKAPAATESLDQILNGLTAPAIED